MRRWAGFNWIVHPRLTGRATTSELCYAYHRNALGFAIDVEGMDIDADYDRQQAYYWARASGHMGSVMLQNAGIVQVVHDGVN